MSTTADVMQNSQLPFQDITQHEIQALKATYNLADAHTHQSQSESQRRIISELPNIWFKSEKTTQRDSELMFINNFFNLLNQRSATKKVDNILLVYAASIAMQIVAIYLMQRRMSVSLIEPCFDNLHDILKYQNITRYPLAEGLLRNVDSIYDNLCEFAVGDALFLVDPNNPTGKTLLKYGTRGFEEVLRFCRDKKKLLILDLTFAPFAVMDPAIGRFDLYEFLEKYQVSYVTMVDTGKTWPIQDTKASALVVSDDIREEIYNIHTSVLLNASPFILNILSHYFEDSAKDRFQSVRGLLERNRAVLKESLIGNGLLEYTVPDVGVSVAWLKIGGAKKMKATSLQSMLSTEGVYILPGTYFYWHEPLRGEEYIRVALARDSDRFNASIARMLELLP